MNSPIEQLQGVDRAKRIKAFWGLVLLAPVPTIGAVMAMVVPETRGTWIGQGMYTLAKVWILALPIVWLLLVNRDRLSWSPPRKGGFGMGVASGLVISVVIIATWWLFGDDLIDREVLRNAVESNGIGTPMRFIGFALFLSLINALLEEYVWRWFVFRQCETLSNTRIAVGVSALLFTLHHIVALGAQVGVAATVLGSLGVFTGGIVWSWLYGRYRSIWPGYVSHVIVDLAIFGLGWVMIFGG